MLGAADELWRSVNVESRSNLNKSETMLLLKVLDEEQRWSLPGGDFSLTISKFVQGIKDSASKASSGGQEVTEREFKDALLGAVSDYSNKVANSVIEDLKKEYAKMGQQIQ